MNPLISVIVPIYNAEEYLDRCVMSILNQTYKNLEIILVNDGSTDGSPQKCDNYANNDSRIKVIHKSNGGVCSARNAGLDICQGEYIGFVDSDDWIDPIMYEKLLSLCKEEGTVATIGSNQVTESGSITIKRCFSNTCVTKKEFLRNILCRNDGCAIWSRLFPRVVIGDSRFDEDRLNEEILFWISIINRIRNVSYTSAIGYNYYQTEGSLSRTFGKSVHDMIGNSKTVRQYISTYFPSLNREAERFEIYQHMTFLLSCPNTYDRSGDKLCGEVLDYLRKHILLGIRNPYFSCKEKILLIGVSCFPRVMSWLIERRQKRENE